MELLLQGSGSADGIPAMFADSRVSRYARHFGGKDVRSRSAALIDGHLKLDLGPDSFSQAIRDKIEPREWSGIFFTHSHDDHYAYQELQYMLYPFTDLEFAPLTIYGNQVVLSGISKYYQAWPFDLVPTKSFESFMHANYKVTPISAYHMLDEDSMNFIFEEDGKSILYGTDTGVWREPTWEFLGDVSIDLLVLECTEGRVPTSYHGHMDVLELIATVERLRKIGTLHDESIIVSTHHSHVGDLTHNELEEILGPHGITVGFDSLSISI